MATPGVLVGDEHFRQEGRAEFLRTCAPCHGTSGRGDGPNAALFMAKPRNLREGFVAKYSTEALVGRILDGRQLPLELDIKALRRHSSEVSAIERHLKKLPKVDWLTVEDGWTIFANRCGACHGPFGSPEGQLPAGVRAPRDLASEEFQSSIDEEELVKAVRHGRKGMPAMVPRLLPDDAKSVAAFVRILSPGFESYSKICGQCHGDDGVGIGNFDETVGAPAVVFDAEYFGKVSPTKLRESIWHMLRAEKPLMPHMRGQVTKADATKIVEYLKKLPEIVE